MPLVPTRLIATTIACLIAGPLSLQAQVVTGSLPAQWDTGAADCSTVSLAPIQVHEYEPQTYILRESLCQTFEAPFIYLLIGSTRALLIDTGAVAEATRMPIAETVMRLLPEVGGARLPLLIAHTHGHGDHHAGDAQFALLPAVEVIGNELPAVREYFRFDDWPEGGARIDLGDRTVDVLPAPGHQSAHVVFYDSRTELLFTGDFLLPGRLIVNDTAIYQASAQRVADFARVRPVAHVLGAHIELNRSGHQFGGAEPLHHPDERALELTKADLLGLPVALADFNGFYEGHANYVITHPLHNLIAVATIALLLAAAFVWGLSRLIRSWRAKRSVAMPAG